MYKIILLFLLLTSPLILHAQLGGIKFQENLGQWPEDVLYKASIPGGDLLIGRSTLTYALLDEDAVHRHLHHEEEITSYKGHVVRVQFGTPANESLSVAASDTSQELYNYFLSSNPAEWIAGARAYDRLLFKNVYPNIDFELVSMDQHVKYNYIVHPGGNVQDIQVLYEGADQLSVHDETLVVKTTLGDLQEEAPVAYQELEYGREEVEAEYRLRDNQVSFNIGKYRKDETLVIDPLIIFSTFSGSTGDNFGFTATYDAQGHAYGGGTVYAQGFPVTTGAYQTQFKGPHPTNSNPGGGTDCGILKYTPDGTGLVYATYLGGSANDRPHSMVVNSKGELVIYGTTSSHDFPVGASALDDTYNGGTDIFLAVLSPDGTQLRASTFLGGAGTDGINGQPSGQFSIADLHYNYGDHYRGEVIVDDADNILVASCTEGLNIPIVGGVQPDYGGTRDGYIAKLNPTLTGIQWSTFMGGSTYDAAYGITIDSRGDIFVTGGTRSSDFPTTSASYQPGHKGNVDGWIAKLNTDGSQLKASTLFGTSSYDQSYFVQVDEQNRVYITGQTKGQMPVRGNVYSNNASGRQFISRFTNDLAQLDISTTFGGPGPYPNISPSAFLVDLCGRVYVSGWGGGTNNGYNGDGGRTTGMPISPDAYQSSSHGSDFYLLILSENMEELVYGTYFGGQVGEEHVDGGTSRFDRNGIVYQSVCAGCPNFSGGAALSDFPTTEGAWSNTNNGRRPFDPSRGGCNNAVFKIDLNSSNYPPRTEDTVLVVNANDQIDFRFVVDDEDKKDSVFIDYEGDIFTSGTAKMMVTTNIGRGTGRFIWQPGCADVTSRPDGGQDTIVVTLHLADDGCPTPKTSTSTIKIVVKEPPVPEPPAIFCMKRPDSRTVQLNWSEFKFDPWTDHYNLVKRHPDGREEVVKQITDPSDRVFTDHDVPNYRTQNFCYLIYGVNICGKRGDSSRWECSVPTKDSIPPPAYVYTATVVQNEFVKVVWDRYSQDDFYEYRLERKKNTPQGQWKEIAAIKAIDDTVFIDSSVNVHTTSYCYRVNKRNECMLNGPASHIGCTILLEGESVPFEHHLNWTAYQRWKGGVNNYSILRQPFSLPESRHMVVSKGALNAVDDTLNYDIGLYWYTIEAEEGSNGHNATSRSNTIELVQPPLLHVPSAFSPNGDPHNNLWGIVPVFVKEYHLQVYNRWGEMVFETFDRHQQWRGVHLEENLWENVFVYRVSYTGWDKSQHYEHGTVTIIW